MMYLLCAAMLSLVDADIRVAARILNTISGKPVVIALEAAGKVNVVSGDLKKDEAVAVLIKAIEATGNAVNERGSFYEITKRNEIGSRDHDNSGNNGGGAVVAPPSAPPLVTAANPARDTLLYYKDRFNAVYADADGRLYTVKNTGGFWEDERTAAILDRTAQLWERMQLRAGRQGSPIAIRPPPVLTNAGTLP